MNALLIKTPPGGNIIPIFAITNVSMANTHFLHVDNNGELYANAIGATNLNASALASGTVPGVRLGDIGSTPGGFVTTNGSGTVEFSWNAAGLTNLNQFRAHTTNFHSFTVFDTMRNDNVLEPEGSLEPLWLEAYHYSTAGANKARKLGWRYTSGTASSAVFGEIPAHVTYGRTNCTITHYILTTNTAFFNCINTLSIVSIHSPSNSFISGNSGNSADGTLNQTIGGTNIFAVTKSFSVTPTLTNATWSWEFGPLSSAPTNNTWWVRADVWLY